MLTFDLMNALQTGYASLWSQRAYLLRLALIPFLIAYLNGVIVDVVFPDMAPLRRALLLLPAMLAEAWVVAQFLRTLLTGEVWPMRIVVARGQSVPPALMSRVRGLLSGMLLYLLIALLFNAFSGVVITLNGTGQLEKWIDENNPVYGLANFIVLVVMIRFFALFWMYIPAVVNTPLRSYLGAVRPFAVNIYLIALWLMATLPLTALVLLVLGVLGPATAGQDAGAFIAFLVTSLVATAGKFLIALVTSAVIAAALRPILKSS